MLKPDGMAKTAFAAIIKAFTQAGINPEKTSIKSPRIVQTLGDAPASANTHGRDGYDTDGKAYSAAVDISYRHDLSQPQVDKLLKALWANGFVAWQRNTGSFAGANQHIHAIFCGLVMKKSLRAQVHSFLKWRSGLVGDVVLPYLKKNLPDTSAQKCRTLFLSKNQAVGALAPTTEDGQGFDDGVINDNNYADFLPDECDLSCCAA